MKNAILFHGTGCSPQSYWFPYLTSKLRERGYDVWAPQLPDAETPRLASWLPFVLENGAYTPETIIVGHSAGCPLTLSLLENIGVRIKKAILVAGYSRPKEVLEKEPILQASYDWRKIKAHAEEFYFINSDNDPWGCTDVEGRYMLDHLGGTLIIKKGEGHMGSDTYHQPYKEFPLLVKLVEL